MEEEEEKNEIEEKVTSKQYMDMMRTVTKVREYILIGLTSNIKARNDAIISGNELAFKYFRGGLDVITDIKSVLDGFTLMPFKDEKSRVPEIDMMHG